MKGYLIGMPSLRPLQVRQHQQSNTPDIFHYSTSPFTTADFFLVLTIWCTSHFLNSQQSPILLYVGGHPFQ